MKKDLKKHCKDTCGRTTIDVLPSKNVAVYLLYYYPQQMLMKNNLSLQFFSHLNSRN